MTWSLPPYADSDTSVSMIATTATDDSGVQYYFERIADGNIPSTNSGWIDSTMWTDTDLDPNTTYTYRVKARDNSLNNNETEFSATASASTDEVLDTIPPEPNPSQWAVRPYRQDPIYYMEAVVADDTNTGGSNPVWYYFKCVGGKGADSGWQTSPTFTTPSNYSHSVYVVYTKDNVGNQTGQSESWATYQ